MLYKIGRYIGKNVLWDRAVICEKEQSHMGQTSLIWDRPVSYGTESKVGQRILKCDKAVSCRTDQSYVGQNIIMWDKSI